MNGLLALTNAKSLSLVVYRPRVPCIGWQFLVDPVIHSFDGHQDKWLLPRRMRSFLH